MFGGQTDPIPYITAAYCVAGFLLVGYAAWQLTLRKKLRRLEAAVEEGARR